MTATAANARLMGASEGPSDAWRTALALLADAQQSRPSAKSLHFCRVSTRPRMGRELFAGVVAPHEAVQSGASRFFEWLIGRLGRGRHVNDVLCPVRSMIPA
jgi:hypothetical protein